MLPCRLREFSLIHKPVILSRGRTPERRTPTVLHAPCRLREFSPECQNLCETRNPYECHPESRANARAKDPDPLRGVILSRGRAPERRTPTLPHAPMPPQGIFTRTSEPL